MAMSLCLIFISVLGPLLFGLDTVFQKQRLDKALEHLMGRVVHSQICARYKLGPYDNLLVYMDGNGYCYRDGVKQFEPFVYSENGLAGFSITGSHYYRDFYPYGDGDGGYSYELKSRRLPHLCYTLKIQPVTGRLVLEKDL